MPPSVDPTDDPGAKTNARLVDEVHKRMPAHCLRRLFFRLDREQQRVALTSARICRVRCLGFRRILRVDGDDTRPAFVRGNHYAQCLILVHAIFRLQNRDNEFTWRIVVVDQDALVQTGRSTLICSLLLGLVVMSFIGWPPMTHRPAWADLP
jgi:hypothetical protein